MYSIMLTLVNLLQFHDPMKLDGNLNIQTKVKILVEVCTLYVYVPIHKLMQQIEFIETIISV